MGLEDGEKYEFRVSAVNEHGQSEPLVTSRPVVAKYDFGEWHNQWQPLLDGLVTVTIRCVVYLV